MDFKIAIEQDEDGWYIVTVPALPGCISQGKTEEEAKKNIAEAIELHLSALARDGIPLYHRFEKSSLFFNQTLPKKFQPDFDFIFLTRLCLKKNNQTMLKNFQSTPQPLLEIHSQINQTLPGNKKTRSVSDS